MKRDARSGKGQDKSQRDDGMLDAKVSHIIYFSYDSQLSRNSLSPSSYYEDLAVHNSAS